MSVPNMGDLLQHAVAVHCYTIGGAAATTLGEKTRRRECCIDQIRFKHKLEGSDEDTKHQKNAFLCLKCGFVDESERSIVGIQLLRCAGGCVWCELNEAP